MKISSAINNRKKQEVVIDANPAQLKALANWLLEQADQIEKQPHFYSHRHISELKIWHKNWPDIIVQNSRFR